MSLMGIITNSKNEEYMVKELSDYFPFQNIIFITDKNIENVRNIKFEILAIDCNIKNIDILKLIISNAKFIILNADLTINIGMLENLDLTIITYGFNNKATLTVSSVAENNIIICLQRIIKNIFEQKKTPSPNSPLGKGVCRKKFIFYFPASYVVVNHTYFNPFFCLKCLMQAIRITASWLDTSCE